MDFKNAIKLKDSNEKIEIENHFKLFAGPGAGKTTFLINHINNIIESSDKISDLRKIACITYTNIGVKTITDRLEASNEFTEVATIHSFLYKNVIKPYLWVLEDDYDIDVSQVNGHDNIIPTYTILKEWKIQTQQFVLNDDTELKIALPKLRWKLDSSNELRDVDNFVLGFNKPWHGKVGKYNIRKNSYLDYKKICWSKGLLSHDDVLYFSYKIIQKEPRIQEIIRGKFPYIIIDEFQDTNPIQTKFLQKIAEKETVIGVIGDVSQSIYHFQDAKPEQFYSFILKNMRIYYIEDNHRSTDKIINVLNHMRSDDNEIFKQKSPKNKFGEKPIIFVGNAVLAYEKIKQELDKEELYALSYANEDINYIEHGSEDYVTLESTASVLFGDDARGERIFYIVHAVECGRANLFKDALKYMKKAFRRRNNFSDKEAIENLKRYLDRYNKFSNSSIKDFYNEYIHFYHDDLSRITSGKKKENYEKLKYSNVSILVNVENKNTNFRTIHGAKGDEFNNVLVIIDSNEKNSDSYLDFLLKPNMKLEEHRVYYVALSRAKKDLFITVSNMSDSIRNELENVLKLFKIEDV